MIRVVLDANILVSGFANDSGLPATLVDMWRAEIFQLVVSQHTIVEIKRAWAKPYWQMRFSQRQIDRAVRLLLDDADITPITAHVEGVATHAEDDLVLATAISGKADYLITGDIPFRRVGEYRGVVLLTPREFLTLLEREVAGDE